MVSLLLLEGELWKTTQFSNPIYVGDPINAVRIFNELRVDEILISDIGSSDKNFKVSFPILERIGREAQCPLTYVGGVRSAETALRINGLGYEKIGVASALFDEPETVADMVSKLGAQSVSAVIDVRRRDKQYFATTENGRIFRSELSSHIKLCSDLRVGELVINDVDREGSLLGVDKALLKLAHEAMDSPILMSGGVSSYEEAEQLVSDGGQVSVAVGSIAVFNGKYRSVLLSYPPRENR